jgi:hypothetical protein
MPSSYLFNGLLVHFVWSIMVPSREGHMLVNFRFC